MMRRRPRGSVAWASPCRLRSSGHHLLYALAHASTHIFSICLIVQDGDGGAPFSAALEVTLLKYIAPETSGENTLLMASLGKAEAP